MNDEQENQERREGSSSGGGSRDKDSGSLGKIVVGLFLIFFLPAVLLGLSIYAILLRKLRQKISVVFTVAVFLILAAIITWKVSGALDRLLFVVQNVKNIDVYWTNLLPALISVNIGIGAIIGFILIFWEVRQMKSNPHRLELEGSWMYNFKFRRTPFESYKRKKKIQGLKDGKYQFPDKVALGIDDDDNIVYRYNSEMHQSTLLSGTVGSGKTITLLNSMHSDILNAISILVIDFKRSKEFSSKLARWAADNDRNFYHFVNGHIEKYDILDSPGQAFYDPLKNGGAAKADMILGMREYDTAAAVYKQGMRELLQTLFAILPHVNQKKTKNIKWDQGEIYKINSIVNGLNGSAHGNLTEFVDATAGTEVENIARDFELKVKNKTSSLHNAFLALQGQMSTLVNSEYGQWLKYDPNGRNIDLYKLLKDPGNVVLFSMDGESEKDFAKYMGSLILSDLSATSAMRRHNAIDDHVNIYIDEFQAVSPSSLAPLLEKSRASGFGVTMASQSYEQIISAAEGNGEAQLNSILDTCANFIVHAGATERSAERLSNIVGKGKKTVYRQANQNQSFIFSLNWKNRRNQMVSTSTETDWISPPSDFMNLSLPKKANDYRTTAVIVKKSSDDPSNVGKDGTVIKKVWMIPNNKVLENYATSNIREEDTVNDEISVPDELAITGHEIDNLIAEREFDIPEPPLDYMNSKGSDEYSNADELDNLDPYGLDDDNEASDGDFEFEIIDEEEEKHREEQELLNSINIESLKKKPKKESSSNNNTTKTRPQIVDYDEDLDDEPFPGINVNDKVAEEKGQSQVTKPGNLSKSLPKLPNAQRRNTSNSMGLPLAATGGGSKESTPSFGSMVGDQDFKPAKRRKERPPIVDNDNETEDDSLPDFDF